MSFDEFGELVAQHYAPLYKFAFSLTRAETDASDLTQQTFYLWATKGHQLREGSKAKSWLFTTLHRIFLQARRRQPRFPQRGLDEVAPEDLPAASPPPGDRLDSAQVLRALAQVDEVYQGAVALFYLEDCSYKEIAEILEVAEGTVKSRISRGITQLRHLLGCSGPTPCRPPANPGNREETDCAVAPLEDFRKISQNFSPAGVTSPLVARAIPMAPCVVIGEQAAVRHLSHRQRAQPVLHWRSSVGFADLQAFAG